MIEKYIKCKEVHIHLKIKEQNNCSSKDLHIKTITIGTLVTTRKT